MRMRNILACLIGLLVAIPALAQPIGEWDVFSIHLNGDNDSSISANITFPLGITIPDLTSGTQQIVLGDGSSGSGLTGNGFIYLEDDGFSSRTLNLLGGNSSLNSGVGFILQGGSSTAALASGGGFFLYGGGGGAGGSGGDIQIRGGAAGSSGIGGIVMLRGGTASGGTYGYIRTAQTGTPGHFTLSNVTTRDSLYVVGNLEVDGTTWLDGSTYLASLTGILKATSGLVAVASSSDILTAIGTIDISSNTNLAVSSPITLTGDTVGFDFSTNNTWSGTNLYTNYITMQDAIGIYFRETSQQIYSSAKKTLDLDSSDTLNFRIAGIITTAVTAGDLTSSVNVTISKSSPTLFLTDPANDDWKIDTITGSFRIFNVTDTSIPFLVTAAGAITLGNSTAGTTLTYNVPTGASHTWQVNGSSVGTWSSTMFTPVTNVTISKATPLLQFTDSGGDDYSIDVGAAAASRFRIRNTTDSTTAFDVDGTNRIAMSTSYSPQTAYKVYVQDRQTAASPSAAYAALSSSMEYLPAATTSTMNQNLHGYQGGITVYATNGSISGSGAFMGLRGDTNIQLGNALTNSQSTTGLFGSMSTTQASGTGGISSLGNAVSTFISAGANTTITTAAHFRVGNSSASGTIGTLYGFYVDAFSVGTNRYEGWMGTDAGWFFREAGNQINSSAAATLDIDATTTTNFRIGTAIEASIAANRMTFNNGASDTYLDWTNSGRLEVGGGIFQASGTLVAQATSFTPYASGYELSVQSAGTAAYIEILANTGAGLGSFFGTEVFSAGSNVHFALYNWEGQALGSGNFPITFYGGYGSIELAKFDRTGGVVFNDTGEDVDFRVESDTDANNIFSDASANFVGIGTASPGVKLDVAGAIRATTDITSTDTGDLGWAVVDGTDNTACTSQCTNAAVFGFNITAGVYTAMVGPSDATADICVCAGAS